MPVRNLVSIVAHYWTPPIYTANWKLTVERSDGTIDDITDIATFAIDDGLLPSIGIFEVTIPNPNETYSGVWTGMEIFRYYKDYAATATTLRFRGRVEKSSAQNNSIKITGRTDALFVYDQEITEDYDNVDAGYAMKDLFDTYGGGRFDTSGINVSTGINIELTFSSIPFNECVDAICTAAGYSCYIDCNLVVQFFIVGSRANDNEGIVHDYNLIKVGDFASDLQFVKNQIRVIGGTIDGVQVTYTANDTTSQATHGIRRQTINDDGITTFAAAKDLADFLLEEQKNPPLVGEVMGVILATLQPGENIRMSSPLENLPLAGYMVSHYKDEWNDTGGTTTATINKEPQKVSHVLKDMIQREHKKSDSTGNPNDLDFADIELFNASTGTLSNTTITNGILQVTSGQTQGTWTSPVYNTADNRNVDQIRIGPVGDNLPNVRIEVSADNGLNYETVDRDELRTIGATGKSIKVKLTLFGSTTQVDSLKIQYSTTS